ncbi:Hypothetical_protein [Hexamita inflata]|uniref:Hypothetical_protein n=1 Tax=Hexamita inflata TaxID=28002 RepID=A0ABP1HE25_9EUKA
MSIKVLRACRGVQRINAHSMTSSFTYTGGPYQNIFQACSKQKMTNIVSTKTIQVNISIREHGAVLLRIINLYVTVLSCFQFAIYWKTIFTQYNTVKQGVAVLAAPFNSTCQLSTFIAPLIYVVTIFLCFAGVAIFVFQLNKYKINCNIQQHGKYLNQNESCVFIIIFETSTQRTYLNIAI